MTDLNMLLSCFREKMSAHTWYGCFMTSGIMECAADSTIAAVVAPVTEAARFPDRHASFRRQPCSPMTAPTNAGVGVGI